MVHLVLLHAQQQLEARLARRLNRRGELHDRGEIGVGLGLEILRELLAGGLERLQDRRARRQRVLVGRTRGDVRAEVRAAQLTSAGR